MRPLFLTVAATTLMVAASSVPAAGNPTRGLEKSQVCQACHGQDGNLAIDKDTPKLGGQHADYLAHALKQYRSGERRNAIMNGFAATLSDQDIADLAAWYSRQEGLVTPRLGD